MIISCGGVSVGDYDCVKPAIKSMGGTIVFDSVAIRPGKPVTFGFLNDKPFFGLPGNPVSAMVTFELFVRPAILQMSGYPLEKCCRPQIDAILTEEISHEPGRRSFARGKVEFVDATIRVTPSGKQRSDQISGMAESNALIVIHEDSQTLPAESKVKVMLLD
jgi:molybdopterin molybdotransferase